MNCIRMAGILNILTLSDHWAVWTCGNVRNFGVVYNLPEGCCVEVPVLASRRGLNPMHIWLLPEHLAILFGAFK